MKTGRRWSGCRRSLLRAAAPALLALLTASAATARATDLSVPQRGSDVSFVELVAADGAAWAVGWDGRVVRVSASGRLHRYGGERPENWYRLSRLTPLPRGSAALVSGDVNAPRTIRYRPDGTIDVTRLPRQVADAGVAAVTADGATWFARSCADRLWRVAPGGATRVLRLPRLGCDFVDEWNWPERAQTLVRAGGGAVWLANVCQGRIVRAGRRGRPLVRTLAPACVDDEQGLVARTPAVLEPRGALRLPGLRIGAGGTVRRSPAIAVAPQTAADGSGWALSADGRQATVSRPGSAPRTISFGSAAAPLYVWALAPSRNGAVFVATPSPRDGPLPPAASVRVGAVRADGSVVTRPLPGWNDSLEVSRLLVAAGVDEDVWVAETVLRPREDHGLDSVGRIARVALGDRARKERR